MKSQEPQEKKFRQLSDQELEKVTGGTGLGIADPSQERCFDKANLPGGKCGSLYSIEKGDQCCMEGRGIGIGAGIDIILAGAEQQY